MQKALVSATSCQSYSPDLLQLCSLQLCSRLSRSRNNGEEERSEKSRSCPCTPEKMISKRRTAMFESGKVYLYELILRTP